MSYPYLSLRAYNRRLFKLSFDKVRKVAELRIRKDGKRELGKVEERCSLRIWRNGRLEGILSEMFKWGGLVLGLYVGLRDVNWVLTLWSRIFHRCQCHKYNPYHPKPWIPRGEKMLETPWGYRTAYETVLTRYKNGVGERLANTLKTAMIYREFEQWPNSISDSVLPSLEIQYSD